MLRCSLTTGSPEIRRSARIAATSFSDASGPTAITSPVMSSLIFTVPPPFLARLPDFRCALDPAHWEPDGRPHPCRRQKCPTKASEPGKSLLMADVAPVNEVWRQTVLPEDLQDNALVVMP
jgi:hypothetical protein